MPYSHPLPSHLLGSPKNQQLAVRLEGSSLATSWSRSGLELFESPLHGALLSSGPYDGSLEGPASQAAIICPDLKLTQCKDVFSGVICQKRSETINCLILQLPGFLWQLGW